MALTTATIMAALEEVAPVAWAEDWDAVGLQVGRPDQPVNALLVALELTPAVLARARAERAELILVHHPLLFDPLTAVRTDQPAGRLLAELLRCDYGLLVAHTNLDAAPRVSPGAVLAAVLGLRGVRPLLPLPGETVAAGETGGGRVGDLPAPQSLAELAATVRDLLAAPDVRWAGDGMVQRVAVLPGSGKSGAEAARAAGAQVLITGEIGYHPAAEARAAGLALITAGHAESESPCLAALAAELQRRLADQVRVVVAPAPLSPWSGA
ncbi:MAG TPA: Nif3-like dinuclear metal center hexameric protein [Armatimonadota bacterium]|jgi:dinuclear metal center YbgI/SA1388 family protein